MVRQDRRKKVKGVVIVWGRKKKVRGGTENKNRSRHRGELGTILILSWLLVSLNFTSLLRRHGVTLPFIGEELGAKLGSRYTKSLNFSLLFRVHCCACSCTCHSPNT